MSISSAVRAAAELSNGHEGTSGPLSPELLERMLRYWHAVSYLTVAQIYVQAGGGLPGIFAGSVLDRVIHMPAALGQ